MEFIEVCVGSLRYNQDFMCSVSKCMVLAININLNQLSYFIFSQKMNLTEIKHMHDWWSHFYSQVIDHARKKLLELKLHGRPFIWHSPAASHLLALSAALCPFVLVLYWQRGWSGTRFIPSSFAKGPLLRVGNAEKWFPWTAVILEFCSFGRCFWESSAPLLALCSRGMCHPRCYVTNNLGGKVTRTVPGLMTVPCVGSVGPQGSISVLFTGIEAYFFP